MRLGIKQLPRVIDISAVKAAATIEEVKEVAELAKKFNFICAFAMPCFTKMLIEQLRDYPETAIGGAVGFPSGADTTEIKVSCAKQLIGFGCNEIDMVINIGALKSGEYNLVSDDIAAVVEASGKIPVKSILEISYLTDDEIFKASKLAVDAGVAFVKTGTGWGDKPTTVETIKIIKKATGERAKVKAAGGVRTLEDLETMYAEGCSRFGIGAGSAVSILKSAYEREGLRFGD